MAQMKDLKVRHSRAASLPQSLAEASHLKDLYQQQKVQLASLMQQLRDKSQEIKALTLQVRHIAKDPASAMPPSHSHTSKSPLAPDFHSFWIEDDHEECSFAEVASTGLWVANPSLRKAGKSPVEVKQISVKRLKQSWKASSVMHSMDRELETGCEPAPPLFPPLDRYLWNKTSSGKALKRGVEGKAPAKDLNSGPPTTLKTGLTQRKTQRSSPRKPTEVHNQATAR